MFVYESKYLKKGDKVKVKQEYCNDLRYVYRFMDSFAEIPLISYKNVIFIVDIIDTRNNSVLIRGQNEKLGAWCRAIL